jgi:hypothetical protein
MEDMHNWKEVITIKPQIIVMLTNNDRTVKDASFVFENCVDLPIKFWGFKNVGIPDSEMIALSKQMKGAGKTTFLEVVTFTEDDCMRAAQLADDCKIDYLTGTVFYPSILEFIKDRKMKYFPFCGDIYGSPINLKGEVKDIVDDSKKLKAFGADGVDLVAYRYQGQNPLALARQVIQALGGENVIIAGSINSLERIQIMNEISPFAYTMGSALFEGKFVRNGSFRENLEFVAQVQERYNGRFL